MYKLICGKCEFSDILGQTPLHLAAYWGLVECIKICLHHGADKLLRNVCNLHFVAKSLGDNILFESQSLEDM